MGWINGCVRLSGIKNHDSSDVQPICLHELPLFILHQEQICTVVVIAQLFGVNLID